MSSPIESDVSVRSTPSIARIARVDAEQVVRVPARDQDPQVPRGTAAPVRLEHLGDLRELSPRCGRALSAWTSTSMNAVQRVAQELRADAPVEVEELVWPPRGGPCARAPCCARAAGARPARRSLAARVPRERDEEYRGRRHRSCAHCSAPSPTSPESRPRKPFRMTGSHVAAGLRSRYPVPLDGERRGARRRAREQTRGSTR